jgi:hypothetical protein
VNGFNASFAGDFRFESGNGVLAPVLHQQALSGQPPELIVVAEGGNQRRGVCTFQRFD